MALLAINQLVPGVSCDIGVAIIAGSQLPLISAGSEGGVILVI